MTIVDSDQTTRAQTKSRRQFVPDWLKPVKSDSADGTMALVDHLRELRYRVIISVVAITISFALCWNWHEFLYRQVFWPYKQAITWYQEAHPTGDVNLVTDGIAGAFMLNLKTCLYAAIIVSCPIWLYQVWAFIAPGLLAKEKKYALAFMGAAIPLFLSGVALAYWIAPKGFAVLLGFTPEDVTNLQDVSKFLQFLVIMLLVFGGSFLLPVILVALNLMGIVRAHQLSRFRIPAIFICFVFGAFATPSVDPFSMLAMAIPMALMYIISEVICHANDRRRGVTVDDEVLAELDAS